MATYYHGNSEIQADGLQTLVLTNPGYVGFSDPQSAAAHFAFHNPSSAGAANSYSHAPPHFVGHPQDISLHHGLPPRPHYVSWNPMEVAAGGGEREGPRPQQGLSLSLSPQQPARYEAYYGEQEGVPSQALPASGLPTQVGESLRMPGGSSLAASGSGITNAVSGMQSVLLSSRYLKAAQLLLEEFVNVGNGMKNESAAKRPHGKMVGESSACAADGDGDKRCPEQSTAGRQEVLMKKAKLVSMLDEVEQRYRQYQQQMQMVIAGFEQMAGIGSAKTYTALALKTISKQFRSLNDAIDGQIAAANRSLGEDVSTTGGKAEGSRLRFVDHQLRQQRALQQLGMIQHSNAWRPQRGLPERAVSVLRAWLFEHFLHPYPKDSDKHMLAKQTGLTRNQVSNWFINARVRLWKPMVEEMYTEEIKEHEQNQSDKTSTSDGFADKCPIPDNKDGNSTAASVSLAGVTAVTAMASQGSPKRPRTTESRLFASDSPDVDVKPEGGNPNDVVWMKFGVDGQSPSPRQGTDEYSANFIGGFGSYPMGEIGRFDAPQHFPASFTGSGNAHHVNGNVSLTLGLPHCENLPLSGSDRRNYLPNHGIQMVGPAEYSGLSTAAAATVSGFEDLNIQSQKRFAAQLLPDFVA